MVMYLICTACADDVQVIISISVDALAPDPFIIRIQLDDYPEP